MSVFTKAELTEMWKRPVERQYNIALGKIIEAIYETQGDISLSFSGGKDSALMADMYCGVLSQTDFKGVPVKLTFANTTNETAAVLSFIGEFKQYLENKFCFGKRNTTYK